MIRVGIQSLAAGLFVAFLALLGLQPMPRAEAQAEGAAAPATETQAVPGTASEGTGPSLELNKLEPNDSGCRAYIVVNNQTDTTYEALKLDLVLFQADGIIGRRFALDLAPVRPQKKSVKLFEIDSMACDKIGSFLINDVMECKTDSGAQANCLKNLRTSSLTNVQLSK